MIYLLHNNGTLNGQNTNVMIETHRDKWRNLILRSV